MPADLNGARVLLTGATGGIGNALARALHGRGAHVIATGRRREQLDSLAGDLGDRIEPVTADLASKADVDRLIEQAGRVDVFVSNAALPGSGAIETFEAEQIDRAIEVNLRAPMQLTRALVPAMRERGSGHVVFISSMSGKVANGYGTIYGATKGGLRTFGLALNDELHGSGVGVTVVNPGFVREAGMFADSGVKLPPWVRTSPMDDVAKAVISGAEKGRTEVDVAPLPVRLGARLYGVAPAPMTAVMRALGGHKVAKGLAESQTEKR